MLTEAPSVDEMLAGRRSFSARGDYAGGTGGYNAAKSDRLQSDWTVWERDPRDLWTFESSRISARAEDLARNNAYAVAIRETIIAGVIGPKGLWPKSAFQVDNAPDTTEAEQAVRDIINAEICDAYEGTRFDAAGQLSKRDMSAVALSSCVTNGDGFAVRCWKPNRPGTHTHATCWRLIHPSRVSNAGNASNDATHYEGLGLDADGTPISVTMTTNHPASVQEPLLSWYAPIAIYGPDGVRNVVHIKRTYEADSPRGLSWFAAIMGLLQQLGKTQDAYVAAKRIQACNVYVVEADDPALAAASDSRGSVLGPNSVIKPGRVYYVRKGCAVQMLNGAYQGTDFDAFSNVLLTAMSASLNLPVEFVMAQLTKANLASARAALMQAWATFTVWQELLITQIEQPWVESVIYESWLRGRIPVTEDQLPRAYKVTYSRPATAFPDPAREIAAAEGKARLGYSPSTIMATMGADFEEETAKKQRDLRLMEAKGVSTAAYTDPAPADPNAAGDGGEYDPAVEPDKKKPEAAKA